MKVTPKQRLLMYAAALVAAYIFTWAGALMALVVLDLFRWVNAPLEERDKEIVD